MKAPLPAAFADIPPLPVASKMLRQAASALRTSARRFSSSSIARVSWAPAQHR